MNQQCGLAILPLVHVDDWLGDVVEFLPGDARFFVFDAARRSYAWLVKNSEEPCWRYGERHCRTYALLALWVEVGRKSATTKRQKTGVWLWRRGLETRTTFACVVGMRRTVVVSM